MATFPTLPLLVLVVELLQGGSMVHVSAFSLPKPRPAAQHRPLDRHQNHRLFLWSRHSLVPLQHSNVIDYEYEPSGSKQDAPAFVSDLPSLYPNDTPAGLRGEAVRSALRSTQCIGWSNSNDKDDFFGGCLTLEGPGCLEFLNNLLSQTFSLDNGNEHSFKEAALLTSKGRLVDRLGVAAAKTTAYLFTSPGHTASDLCERLNKYIFPLDQVTLQQPPHVFQFTLASYTMAHVQRVFQEDIWPRVQRENNRIPGVLPQQPDTWLKVPLSSSTDGGSETVDALSSSNTFVVIPSVSLPSCAAVGCTFAFLGPTCQQLGQSVWQHLTKDNNPQGPVAIGPLEYESLRIEAGQPRFGHEITGHLQKTRPKTTPASPLELFWETIVNQEKGCYMGQEGIASMLKNPRGPPRTLYQVVFDDEFNVYDYETQNDQQANFLENKTRPPIPSDTLCVLGSNEEIAVGTVTSVAEPGSTGDPTTVALALVRRPDGILSAMKERDLEISTADRLVEEEGVILPPPMDPLDGLEVIVKSGFAVGTLRSIPSRRTPVGRNMFVETGFVEPVGASLQDKVIDVTKVPLSSTKTRTSEVSVEETKESSTAMEEATNDNEAGQDDAELAKALEEAEKEAEAAAAEAKRKADKMEMLKKRAEAAMARRRAKQNNKG